MHKRIPPQTEAAICVAYRAGDLVTAIARDYAVSVASVHEVARRNNLPKRGHGGRPVQAGSRRERVRTERAIPLALPKPGPARHGAADLDHLSPHRTRAERQAAQLAGYYESEQRR